MLPQWLNQGLVMLSNHEPLTFRIRRGKQRVDEAAYFQAEHSEEFVRKAARFGITCLRTHYYKGGGIKYESPEMRMTADFVKICHKHGIRVQGYVQHGTLSYETLFLEEPKAKEWVAIDQYGLKSSVTYGYQFFRYKPCYNRKGFIEYIKKIVRKGIEDGLDMFGFDNSAWSVEPVACQCPVCKGKFREFLNRKYRIDTSAGRKMAMERFALANFKYVEPPNWHRWAMPINMFECDEPMIQEWVDFKCECIKENIAEIGQFAKRLKPDIVMEWNCYTAFGDNGPLWAGVDVYRNMPHLDVVYNEQDPFAGINRDGVLTNMIRAFKLFKAYGKFMLPNTNYHAADEEQLKLSMAENLAFNSGHIGMLPGGYTNEAVDTEKHPSRKRYVDFAAQNREIYSGAAGMADVAVLESFDTLAFTRIEPYHSLVAVYQTLISNNIQYNVLTLDRLPEINKYRLVILPDVKLLSDEHAALLIEYVRHGGRLLYTEQTGMYDSWFRRRGAGVFAGKEGKFGKGRIRGFTKFKHKRRFSYKPEDWAIDPRLWQLPINHKEFLKDVRNLLDDEPVLEVKASFGCVGALYRKRDSIILHLLNYDTTRKLAGVAVRLHVNDSIDSITLMSPEEGSMKPVAFRRSRGCTFFKVSELKRYKIFVMKARPRSLA
jgi:hypothetical protein